MTPLILAVDTTGEHGSLALARGAELLEELPVHAPTGFAHVLYAQIDELLRRHKTTVGEIDCFAAAAGPGSFTGVRVGLACVKGLAEACGKRAVAVSNLAALARFGQAPLRAPMLDARRGEIYGAVYDDAGRIVVAETVGKLPGWIGTLPAGVEFICADFAPFADVLPPGPRVTAPRELAATIAGMALAAEWQDPAALDANYVRRSDAELYWKE